MSKSSIADILEVQRLVSKLDRRGKLEILNYLETELAKPVEQKKVATYKEGTEK